MQKQEIVFFFLPSPWIVLLEGWDANVTAPWQCQWVTHPLFGPPTDTTWMGMAPPRPRPRRLPAQWPTTVPAISSLPPCEDMVWKPSRPRSRVMSKWQPGVNNRVCLRTKEFGVKGRCHGHLVLALGGLGFGLYKAPISVVQLRLF